VDTPDTRIGKEFGIFTESIMLNNLLSIAHENRYQHLDSPETQPSQYISNHPAIQRLSKRNRVDVSYPKSQFVYSRLAQTILPSISLLGIEIQVHLSSTLLSSVMVSDLTPLAYSIQWLIATSSHSLFTDNPTPGKPLIHEYPLCITFECGAASTQSVICQTQNFYGQARLIPLKPNILSESMLDWYVKATA